MGVLGVRVSLPQLLLIHADRLRVRLHVLRRTLDQPNGQLVERQPIRLEGRQTNHVDRSHRLRLLDADLSVGHSLAGRLVSDTAAGESDLDHKNFMKTLRCPAKVLDSW